MHAEIAADIRIEPLADAGRIVQTLRHPRIYPHITDDFSPTADAVTGAAPAGAVYLGAFEADTYLGMFLVHPHNGVLYEIHTCLLPNAWGPRAVRCALAAFAWTFEHTRCRRLITSVPVDNTLALRLARTAGMTEWGRNPRSILRGGVLLDQIMLGIDKD